MASPIMPNRKKKEDILGIKPAPVNIVPPITNIKPDLAGTATSPAQAMAAAASAPVNKPYNDTVAVAADKLSTPTQSTVQVSEAPPPWPWEPEPESPKGIVNARTPAAAMAAANQNSDGLNPPKPAPTTVSASETKPTETFIAPPVSNNAGAVQTSTKPFTAPLVSGSANIAPNTTPYITPPAASFIGGARNALLSPVTTTATALGKGRKALGETMDATNKFIDAEKQHISDTYTAAKEGKSVATVQQERQAKLDAVAKEKADKEAAQKAIEAKAIEAAKPPPTPAEVAMKEGYTPIMPGDYGVSSAGGGSPASGFMRKTVDENQGKQYYSAIMPGTGNSVTGTRKQGTYAGGFVGAATDAEAARNLQAGAEQSVAAQVNIARMNTAVNAERDLRAARLGVSRSMLDQMEGRADRSAEPPAPPTATKPFERPGDRFGDAEMREIAMRGAMEDRKKPRAYREQAARLYEAELQRGVSPKDAAALQMDQQKAAQANAAATAANQQKINADMQIAQANEQGEDTRSRRQAAVQYESALLNAQTQRGTHQDSSQQHLVDKDIEQKKATQDALTAAFTPTKDYHPPGTLDEFQKFIREGAPELAKTSEKWTPAEQQRIAQFKFRDTAELNSMLAAFQKYKRNQPGTIMGILGSQYTPAQAMHDVYPTK